MPLKATAGDSKVSTSRNADASGVDDGSVACQPRPKDIYGLAAPLVLPDHEEVGAVKSRRRNLLAPERGNVGDVRVNQKLAVVEASGRVVEV